MEQLVYTSAPQGLQQGSSGFCTVEMTEGMPPEMMDSLESLSAYDNDPSKTVNWMHLKLNTLRGMRHVFSRVGPLKGEFSGRTNKLAHHICLAPGELPPQGPMRIVGLGGPLQQQWSGEVRHLSPQTTLQNLRVASMPRPCRVWEAAVGDAGAAGAVLSRLRAAGSSPLWVIRTPQMDALMMTDEMLGLLSGPERWGLTFCTYLHTLPRSVECRLRWVLPDSPAMSQVQHIGSDQLIDLRTGPEVILRGADSRMIDAARSGKAIAGVSSSAAMRRTAEGSGGTARRRGVSPVDLNQLGPSSASKQTLPPPPPTQQASPLRWVLLGVGLGSIPACLLLFFLMGSDPKTVAAMRELDAEQRNKPPVAAPSQPEQQVEPLAEVEVPEEFQPPPPPDDDQRDRDKKKKVQQPPPKKVDQGPRIKSEIPIDRQIALRFPIAGAFADDVQTIHSAAGVYEVSLRKIPSVETPINFEVLNSELAGEQDLVLRVANGEQRKVGTIYTEPDRVSFAWRVSTQPMVAAAFVLTHEFLIKDETHHSTVRFQFASPDAIPLPPTPLAREFEVRVPKWLPTAFEVLVKPIFVSTHPDEQVAIEPIAVSAPSPETQVFNLRMDLQSLNDDWIKAAKFMVRCDIVGAGDDRRVRYSSTVRLLGAGTDFDWSQLNSEITEQVRKYNDQQRKKKKINWVLKKPGDRLEVFDSWKKGLSCQLEMYARVGDRVVLCATTGAQPEANTSDHSGGASK